MPIGMEIFARAAIEYLNHLSRRDLATPLSARVFGKAVREEFEEVRDVVGTTR